jgi:hypothetical protein
MARMPLKSRTPNAFDISRINNGVMALVKTKHKKPI